MKFSFSSEQEEFRSNLRRLLADRSPTKEVRRLMETDQGYERDGWRAINTALGLTAIRNTADLIVVLARAPQGLSLFTVDGNAAGLTRGALKSMDLTRKFARLEFNRVLARPLGTVAMAKAAEWTARRARTAQEQGRPQGPEGSLGKLASSIIARAAARVHTSLLGPDALLSGDDSPMNGLLAEILVSVPASSIAGGTDEIQRNIIAERVLRMPKEPRSDDDRPFRDVPKNRSS